jgi:hypothetical protein
MDIVNKAEPLSNAYFLLLEKGKGLLSSHTQQLNKQIEQFSGTNPWLDNFICSNPRPLFVLSGDSNLQ